MTIDRALMPGSKTPSPPAFQIHAWPGCQRRTSSRQTTSTDFSFRAEAHARAGSTPAAWRECQVANRLSFFLGGEVRQAGHLADRGAGRLLEQHVLAGKQGLPREVVPDLRRGANRHRVDLRMGRQHGVDGRIGGRSLQLAVGTGGGGDLEVRIGPQHRGVLVLDDLADADDGDPDGAHEAAFLRARARPAWRRRAP